MQKNSFDGQNSRYVRMLKAIREKFLTVRPKSWICLGIFVVIYLALRVFWLDGDPGIASAWEYGYNATDEGYYLDGGKEKFLWNHFVDLSRHEAYTYGFSAGTHGLSYLAHLVFGLSTWTWRIPFFLITCLAWIVSFVHLSRRNGASGALLLCVGISSIPMQVAYERTASNDVLIGALTVISYVLATGRSKWRLFAAACVTSLIVLVKPSVWVLMPVIAAGVLQVPKFRTWWIDISLYIISAIAGIFVCKLLVALSVLPDAQAAGIGVWEVVKKTTTHYPLPDIFDIASHLKGISAFPRDPSYVLLGVSSVFVFVFPIALAMKNLVNFRFNGNTLLFVAIPTYVAAINVMNTQYTHYFIPALMMLPMVLTAASEEVEATEGKNPIEWRRVLPVLAFLVFVYLVGVLLLSCFELTPKIAQEYYSRVYNFPAKNVWGATASVMALFVGAVVLILVYLRGLVHARRNILAWLVAAYFAGSVIFSALPAIQVASHLHQTAAYYFAPMAMALAVSGLLLVLLFGRGNGFLRNQAMAVFVFASIVVCYLVTPNWRQAAVELIRPATHYHEEATKELAKLLPKDAIVIGERSNQMLMALPIRTATTFAANSDPIPVIQSILKKEPLAKLYALADSQHAYNIQHYREHEKEYALRLIKVFKMPSFGSGKLADVYLCKIDVQK